MPFTSLRLTRARLALLAAIATASVPPRAHAQCAESSGSAVTDAAPEAAAGVETAPRAPLIVISPAPGAVPSVVVQQSVIVQAIAAAPPTAAETSTEEPPPEPAVAFQFGGFGEHAQLGGLGFTFDAPDGVPAIVRNLRVDLAGVMPGDVALGGASVAVSGRPQPWLRGPELRMSLGGGDLSGRTFAPAGAPIDVALSLDSVLVFRLEGAFGLRHDFGPFGLFAVGRLGWGAYFVTARTQEAHLGDLGQETLSAHRAELGTTVGVSILLGGAWHLEASWRRTFTGATGDGLLVELSAELEGDD
jgi:hypothetical protein